MKRLVSWLAHWFTNDPDRVPAADLHFWLQRETRREGNPNG